MTDPEHETDPVENVFDLGADVEPIDSVPESSDEQLLADRPDGDCGAPLQPGDNDEEVE